MMMHLRPSRLGGIGAVLGFLLLGSIGSSIARAESDDAKRQALIAKVAPSVAKIVIEFERGKGHGSGYVVDASGIVITNAHVIKQNRAKSFKRCYITFPNDKDKKQYAI